MIKKYIKYLFMYGLLVSAKISIKAEGPSEYMLDFESYLQPQEHTLLEQGEPMVYMTPNFIEVMKNYSPKIQELKNLADHIAMGYTIASLEEVSCALDQALKMCEKNTTNYEILHDYKKALLNGEALIRTEDLGCRRKKNGRFCVLFVKSCASIANLTVRCNANVLGNITVAGSISASNFTFTGATGCTGPATMPPLSSCGNIAFNTASVSLNAHGALEANLDLIRATISLGVPGITLIPATAAPGAALTVGIATPTSASLINGIGLEPGSMAGTAFSSGMMGMTPTPGTLEYYFVVDLQIPITFTPPYLEAPIITQGIQTTNTAVSAAGTSLADDNSYSNVHVEVSNVTTVGSTLNVVFNVIAQGTSYANASENATIAINNSISNPITLNALCVNLIVDGPIA